MLDAGVARNVTHRYVDPLAQVWLAVARRIGLRVVRTPDAYAATDGSGTLAISDDAALDADDSLSQMIFHELCHSLVEGEAAFAQPDWGMDNTGPDHDWREHACLRAQWVLAGRHGLRDLFAPTTDFRTFWDQLAGDVLAATAQIAQVAARFAAPAADATPSLWHAVVAPPAPHPTGLPLGAADGSCGTCAWRTGGRCRQAATRVDPVWPACERFEPALDCQTCGACCRAAYHSVEVTRRDPVVRAHPSLIVDRGSYLEIRRCGDRCAALHGGAIEHGTTTRYHCAIYNDRPRTCRDFTLGSAHCLTARRRVGLSL
jgi:hypothetical protein